MWGFKKIVADCIIPLFCDSVCHLCALALTEGTLTVVLAAALGADIPITLRSPLFVFPKEQPKRKRLSVGSAGRHRVSCVAGATGQ